jgi:hypothetical protein
LTEDQLLILNMVGDLDDLIPALQRQEAQRKGEPTGRFLLDEIWILKSFVEDLNLDVRRAGLNNHCSSIVKVNDAKTLLMAAQV